MSETSESVVVEPGGWLAEFQRGHCAGDSALSTYQGLVADEIVLPQSAADHEDPAQLVMAASAWTDAMLEQLLYIHGEFAHEASYSYFVQDYLAQAKAGGHGPYYALRGRNDVAIKCVAQGLKSMLANPHLDLFNLMVRLNRLPRPGARKLAQQKGYRDAATALRDLDNQLAELEAREPLMPRHKTWLRSLRKVTVAPDEEMTKHLGRLVANNQLRTRRKAEFDAIRAESERTDPAYVAGRALCEMAGLRFAGLKALGAVKLRDIWPEGPDKSGAGLRIDTDRGAKIALFYLEGGLFAKRLAVLIERGNPLPLGSLSPERYEFEAIAPNLKK
jgi:hypothetical protein